MPKTTPELAIATFESWSGARVTIHDLDHTLIPWLSAMRTRHAHQLCQSVKGTKHAHKCLQLEIEDVRREALKFPDGRIHRCHAGFIECVYPVFDAGVLRWVLFAGPLWPTSSLKVDASSKRSYAPDKAPFKHNIPVGICVDSQDRLTHIMEGLRQLASRLLTWLAQHMDGNAMQQVEGVHKRRQVINQFIFERYRDPVTLKDLAQVLGLSEGRTAHLTREVFDDTFSNLLMGLRIKAASNYLQNTRMTISAVAEQSGFVDHSHFYRVFKRLTGKTPSQFRREAS